MIKKLIQRSGFWHLENMVGREGRIPLFEVEDSTYCLLPVFHYTGLRCRLSLNLELILFHLWMI